MKTFVFSDIHGCYDELMALYRQLPLQPERDRVIFLGDYIDRGPASRRVLEQVMAWQQRYPHWVFLGGNHEDMMLDALHNDGRHYDTYFDIAEVWFASGGAATYRSYLPAGEQRDATDLVHAREIIPEEHRAWCASLPLHFEDDGYIYVHGGVKPGRTPAETDPFDLIWLRDEFLESTYDWGKKIIHGHTPTRSLEPEVYANRICIDTALCYAPNNKLTAVELPAETFYSQSRLSQVAASRFGG
ncbi:MAG: serine/threonine protein phosphatase [Thermomicrobiales bacterium]|nr:serine/threonine protein phosphatase [Thermomicrobiales bacterium]